MKMTYRTNTFAERHMNEHQHVMLETIQPGQSFDNANDCWIDHDGECIHIRGVRKTVSIKSLGLLGACCDALKIWERNRNGDRAYFFANADDPTEMAGAPDFY